MRGRNISEALPEIARMKKPIKEALLPDGSMDLEKIIGSRDHTQEMKAPKNLALFSVLHPEQLIRDVCSDAL